MFECSDSMSYYGQETTCMVPIVIGKCDYSYFLEFGYSFFIVGAKPHSSAALLLSRLLYRVLVISLLEYSMV